MIISQLHSVTQHFFVLLREDFWVTSGVNYKSYPQLLALPKKMDSKVAITEILKFSIKSKNFQPGFRVNETFFHNSFSLYSNQYIKNSSNLEQVTSTISGICLILTNNGS